MKNRFLFIFVLLWMQHISVAQHLKGINDTILTEVIAYNGDTIPYKALSEVYIYAKRLGRIITEQDLLAYRVKKVYPYAVMASYILHDIDSALAVIRSKDARKLYKRRKEDELMKKFKGEIENMSITEGKILIKLISRQTGKDCYAVIKELKGGFNARIWQTVGSFFSHNLKEEYDPDGEDAAIETIVRKIESKGRFIRVNQ